MVTTREVKSSKRDVSRANGAAARQAGLKYVSDSQPGIRRVRIPGGFAYTGTTGRRIRDEATLSRIGALVIPPAWTDVWICTNPRGHLQAVGRDARGRKQYRYHTNWRETRDKTKYNKLADFARVLPKLRRTVRRHLALRGLPRQKVLAAVISIMERTLIRIGNEEYANQNDSYGLTTLKDHHARINGRKVRFAFRGKSGVKHEIDLQDPKLAEIVRRCRDLPGEELFQYLDEQGSVSDVNSTDLNDYLRQITGGDFTTKGFRTWAGTVLAACALCALKPFTSQSEANNNIVRAIDEVASRLGNTRAVCRKCYVHPVVISLYLDGSLAKRLQRKAVHVVRNLPRKEAAVLSLLR